MEDIFEESTAAALRSSTSFSERSFSSSPRDDSSRANSRDRGIAKLEGDAAAMSWQTIVMSAFRAGVDRHFLREDLLHRSRLVSREEIHFHVISIKSTSEESVDSRPRSSTSQSKYCG